MFYHCEKISSFKKCLLICSPYNIYRKFWLAARCQPLFSCSFWRWASTVLSIDGLKTGNLYVSLLKCARTRITEASIYGTNSLMIVPGFSGQIKKFSITLGGTNGLLIIGPFSEIESLDICFSDGNNYCQFGAVNTFNIGILVCQGQSQGIFIGHVMALIHLHVWTQHDLPFTLYI